MKDVGYENQMIYEKYQSVFTGKKCRKVDEATKGIRRKVQILEDGIDDFMDQIEKKIDILDDNPVFQKNMYQMLADTVKEHDEFIMALKRVASTLDSGAKVIPVTRGIAKGNDPFTSNVQGDEQEENPEDQFAKPNDSGNEFQDQSTGNAQFSDQKKKVKDSFRESKASKYLGEGTVKGDTLGGRSQKTVAIIGKTISIRAGASEVLLDKSEAQFLMKSLARMIKEI